MSEYIITDEQIAENRRLHGKKLLVMPVIVRCRDCVWFTNSSHYGAYCTNFGSPLGDDYDGFCAWAERKERIEQ